MCTKKRCKDNGVMSFLVVLHWLQKQNKRLCLNIMKHLIVKVMKVWNGLSREPLQSLFFKVFKNCLDTGTEPCTPGVSVVHCNEQLKLVLQL